MSEAQQWLQGVTVEQRKPPPGYMCHVKAQGVVPLTRAQAYALLAHPEAPGLHSCIKSSRSKVVQDSNTSRVLETEQDTGGSLIVGRETLLIGSLHRVGVCVCAWTCGISQSRSPTPP